MKKKANIREQRESRQNAIRSDYSRIEAEKRAAAAPKPEEATPASKEPEPIIKAEKRKFSRAKAAGLKSTFILKKNELLMTTFGNGNAALLEKRISGENIETIADPEALRVEQKADMYRISGRIVQEAGTDNPLWQSKRYTGDVPKNPGEDLIHCRRQLETLVFGKTFEDNIHIQLAYNILDITKIMAIHINNAVYAIGNMFRASGSEHDYDLIGYLGLDKTYEKFMTPQTDRQKELKELFERLMGQYQLAYFGDILWTEAPKQRGRGVRANPRNADKKPEDDKRKNAYYLLAILGMLRQATAHGAATVSNSDNKFDSLFTLDRQFERNRQSPPHIEAKAALDKLFNTRVQELNKGFLDKAQKDLVILFNVLGVREPEKKREIVRDYYDFIVRKSYKNTGFSIKLLREAIVTYYAPELQAQIYDSVRSRLYRTLDFVLFEYYKARPQDGAALVEKLRASENEAQKSECYRTEVKKLWGAVKNTVVKGVAKQVLGDVIKNIRPDPDVNAEMLSGATIGTDATYFSKIIYLLTNFLDGKEINDLLTTLIHEFDNIAEFISVMDRLGIEHAFTLRYSLFDKSAQIVEELRAINSFARMSVRKEDAVLKMVMMKEAAQILGYDGDIDAYADAHFIGGKGIDHSYRNFIVNNVVNSNRFNYLVRYGNPQKLRALANNRRVVAFVLKDIPDAQLLRYYNSTFGMNEQNFMPEMRAYLCDAIVNTRAADFETVVNKYENAEKERKKAIVRLYLTVLYLLVKNLVYINSRYYLAFYCVERDAMITDMELYGDPKKLKQDYTLFARDFLEKHSSRNRRARGYLQVNMNNADLWAIRAYRNCVDHLDAVRSADRYINDIASFESYFELYHYLMQRDLIDQFDFDTKHWKEPPVMSPKTREYFDRVEKYHRYCKDFVKALNVPFAYNLPRYKNLSINELFDRNHPIERGTDLGDAVIPPEE